MGLNKLANNDLASSLFSLFNVVLCNHLVIIPCSLDSQILPLLFCQFTLMILYWQETLCEFGCIKQNLNVHFKIKDLGTFKFFLGLEMAHSCVEIILCQRRNYLNLLQDFGTLGSHPASRLLDPAVSLQQDIALPSLMQLLIGD